MSLAEMASSVATGIPWQTCSVCHALGEIPDAEAAALRALLASGMRYTALSTALRDDPDTPLELDAQALSRHARGRCSAREKLRG